MTKKLMRIRDLALAGTLIFAIGCAEATLIDRGDGTVLDTSTSLMWLKDANYAATELTAGRIADIINHVGSIAGHTLVSGDFVAGAGNMTWWGAMAWAQELTYAGFSDWRLPVVIDTGTPGCAPLSLNTETDCWWNVDPITGELAWLWDVSLGNVAWSNIASSAEACHTVSVSPYCFQNQFPFVNAQAFIYWTGTEYAPDPTRAWDYYTESGAQVSDYANFHFFAWAVRSVTDSAVPEPTTLALLGLGLAGLGLSRRMKEPIQH